MSHDEIVETWLTELAVAPRHRARRAQATAKAPAANPQEARPAPESKGPLGAPPAARFELSGGKRVFDKRRTSC
jgi:hypothetical protein